MTALEHGSRQLSAATMALGVLAALLTIAGTGGTVIGTVCAALLLFILPCAAVAIAYPGEARAMERVAIGAGVAMAAAILGTVLLDALGIRLGSGVWAAMLGAIVCLLSAAGLLRARNGEAAARSVETGARLNFSVVNVGCGLIALGLLVLAVWISIDSKAEQNSNETFTALWTKPASAGASGVTIGVKNREGESRSYLLRAYSGETLLRTWGPVEVDADDLWKANLRVAKPGRLRVDLLSQGAGSTIRRSTSVLVGR